METHTTTRSYANPETEFSNSGNPNPILLKKDTRFGLDPICFSMSSDVEIK